MPHVRKIALRPYVSRNSQLNSTNSSALFFELEAVFVFFEESAQVVGDVEEANPLLVVQRHGETAQAVDADSAFFAHSELESALLSPFALLL